MLWGTARISRGKQARFRREGHEIAKEENARNVARGADRKMHYQKGLSPQWR